MFRSSLFHTLGAGVIFDRAGHSGSARAGLRAALMGGALRSAALGSALVVAALAAPATAQDAQTLADIKAELATVSGQLANLRQELVSGGGGSSGGFVAGSALDRMNAMEALLSQLTSKTEQLEIRINQVVADGTNRIGDLEFRVCEIEPGCDIGSIGKTKPLGGATSGAAPVVAPPPKASAGAELAVGEKADFDRARGVLDQGDFRSAADLYQAFTEAYPGSPLTGEAHFLRGEALMKLGDQAGAARAWLASFSGQPNGPKAADALLNLGMALNTLGQPTESCVTLGEVPVRYPGTEAAQQAIQARNSMGCV